MPLNQISFAFDDAPVTTEPEVKAVAIVKPPANRIKVKTDNKKLTRGRMPLKDVDAGATVGPKSSIAASRSILRSATGPALP